MISFSASLPPAFVLLLIGTSATGLGETGFSGISKPWTAHPPASAPGSASVEGEAIVPEESRLLEGLAMTLATTWFHDTNVNQGNDRGGKVESDWIFSVAPAVSWETRSRDFTLMLGGGANYDHYSALDAYSGLDYRGAAKLGYQGGATNLEGSVNYDSVQGVDRFAGGLTENRSLGARFTARHAVSIKTVLDTSLSTVTTRSVRQTDGAAESDTSQSEFQLGALWKVTPLVVLGPGLRSTWSTADSAGDRTTVGPMLRVEYRLSEKVDLKSRIGIDFVEYDGGGSDEFTSGSVGLKYRLDDLWEFNFELSRDVVPDIGAAGGYREIGSWRFGSDRKILAVRLELGVGYESSELWSGRGVASSSGTDYLNFDAGLSMPVLGESGRARIFVRHQDSSSSDPRNDWSGLQSGLSLSYGF